VDNNSPNIMNNRMRNDDDIMVNRGSMLSNNSRISANGNVKYKYKI
jgi:hypothetical protein